MAAKPWHIGAGILACMVWSAFVGVPLLLFHLTSVGFVQRDRIHALVIFFFSELLIFWLFARPRTPVVAPMTKPKKRVKEEYVECTLVDESETFRGKDGDLQASPPLTPEGG